MYFVMEMEVVKWFLMWLNEVNFIFGVWLGNIGVYDFFEIKFKNFCVFIIINICIEYILYVYKIVYVFICVFDKNLYWFKVVDFNIKF